MNKNIKKNWLKALRSGKYEQGHSRLAWTARQNGRAPSFCCLGVLCESMGVGYKGKSGLPSGHTLKLAGLTKNEANDLARLNDTDRLDFSKIADYISAKL